MLLNKSTIDWNHKNKSHLSAQDLCANEAALRLFRQKAIKEKIMNPALTSTPNAMTTINDAKTDTSISSAYNLKIQGVC